MKSFEARIKFIDYFKKQGHTHVPSSSVIPFDDPTLLFTNAGMNQFKNVFLGLEKRDYKRAVSSQKCIRVSGKHNDLEEVGRDGTHHTFFEMLGNWSFGDYYKREAIHFAWELLTGQFGFPVQKLRPTIYSEDEESFRIWNRDVGVKADLITRLGDIGKGDEENFWSMADVGPCGPCSEIHYDMGEEHGCGSADCRPGCKRCSRFVELWNLVFMEFNRDENGKLSPLPMKSVDTGLGFERLISVLQGVDSNYRTDLFVPVIEEISKISGLHAQDVKYATSFNVVADHIRALVFSISDGAMPSNEGRGYVLRRILRRAARHGRILRLHEPFLFRLVDSVVETMGAVFPEIVEKAAHCRLVVRAEEERFGLTLDRGLEIFDKKAQELAKKGLNVLSGRDAFLLHDTYGFPLDLTQVIAGEADLTVDVEEFEKEMQSQKQKARQSSMFRFFPESEEGMSWNVLDARVEATEFTGYEKLEDIGKLIKFTQKCDKLFFVFDRTPFYGEAGGQAGDSGIIEKDGVRIDVENCVKQDSEIIHIGKVVSGGLSEGDFLLKVDHQKRRATERNHTATHLLHKVLKNILGEHVNQAGSRVEAGRFRFDFTHFKPLSRRELDIVEEQVNGKIIENLVVKWEFHSFENAKKMGATALFGEKYGDVVRVVQVVEKSGSPFSMELCGGTHVSGTGSIGSFRIVSEGSAASGVRRIEALTGFESLRSFRSDAAYLIEASELLKCKTSDVPLKITDIFKELDEKNRELSTMRQSSIAFLVAELIAKQLKIAGVHVISGKVDVNNVDELRACADMVREKIGSGIAVLGAEIQGKASFVAMVTRDLILSKSVKAGEIVREVAKLAGGGGGGADHLAVAGAKDASKLDIALNSVKSILEQRLSNTATNLF